MYYIITHIWISSEPWQGLGSCYTTNNHIDNDNSECYNDNSELE